MMPANRAWLEIKGSVVRGTTKATAAKVTGTASAEAQDNDNPNIMIDLRLSKEGYLEETVVGARASMLYIRCP